eukprot:jgi/Bigna1/90021/estExt_fgenesh1_pg.C_600080
MKESPRTTLPVPLFLILGCCLILERADFFMVPAMFPTLIKDFNVSLTDIGFVYLLQCVVTSIATPFWGMLGDKYSRTLLLGIGCAMWGCFTLGGALSNSFVEFTVFRTVSACFLALVSPLIQSIVADIVAPSHRGRVFGQVSMFGMLGGFCGQFIATTFSNSEMLGLKGWRCCLLIVAIVSFIFTPIVCYTQDYRPSPGRSVQTASNVKNPLKLTTFWILVTQGMFGYVPWRAFGMFMVMYLELIGFSPFQTAVITGAGFIAAAFGNLLSGYVGDSLNSLFPFHGRIYVAQITVSVGIGFGGLLFYFMPKWTIGGEAEFSIYTMVFVIFNILGTWCTNGTNRPIIADIAPSFTRTSIYGYFAALESVPSSFAGFLVSYLAQDVFGYRRGEDGSISSLTAAERQGDIDALSQALFWITVVPWMLTFMLYTTIHFTYKRDAIAVRKSLRLSQRSGKKLGYDSSDDEEEEVESLLLVKGKRIL